MSENNSQANALIALKEMTKTMEENVQTVELHIARNETLIEKQNILLAKIQDAVVELIELRKTVKRLTSEKEELRETVKRLTSENEE
jgi:hypothetical protein